MTSLFVPLMDKNTQYTQLCLNDFKIKFKKDLARKATSPTSNTGSVLFLTNGAACNVISVSEHLGRTPALFLYRRPLGRVQSAQPRLHFLSLEHLVPS